MGRACLHATLQANGHNVAGVINHLAVDPDHFEIEGCVINPELSGLPFNKQLVFAPLGAGQVEVSINGSPTVIDSNDDLFVCILRINAQRPLVNSCSPTRSR
jgi:hypothetical protein